jgi:hypothetical protein
MFLKTSEADEEWVRQGNDLSFMPKFIIPNTLVVIKPHGKNTAVALQCSVPLQQLGIAEKPLGMAVYFEQMSSGRWNL